MPRATSKFVCQQCGHESVKWMGRCPDCGQWNTLIETVTPATGSAARASAHRGPHLAAVPLPAVRPLAEKRQSTGSAELDRVLGGGLVPGAVILMGGEPGIGKCVTGDTRVLDPQSGAFLPITELREKRAPVLSLDESSHRLVSQEVTAFYDQGVRPIVEVKTRLGRTLRCTPSHPVLTPDGWRAVGVLEPGCRIAAPRSLPFFGTESLAEEAVKLIAYVLSDGCVRDVVGITNALAEVERDLHEIAAYFGMEIRAHQETGTLAKSYVFTRRRGGREAIRNEVAEALRAVKAAHQPSWAAWARSAGVNAAMLDWWRRGACVPSSDELQRLAASAGVPVAALAPEARERAEKASPIMRFMTTIGLRDSSATNKAVPDCIFRLPAERVAIFLRTLFTCDGSVYVNKHGQAGISYSTISSRLAQDVQHLLLRFGFVAKLRTKPIIVNNQPYTAYEVQLLGIQRVKRFLDEIGIIGRDVAKSKIAQLTDARLPSSRSDTVPTGPIFSNHVAGVAGGASFKALSRATGTTIHAGRPDSPSARITVRALAQAYPTPYLRNLAHGDIYWDELSSISAAGEEAVYDISVENTPNFVANDLILHNSSVSLSVSGHLAEQAGDVLYVSAEESMEQVKLRAERFGITSEHLLLLAETGITAIIETIEQLRPSFVVVDSIQTVASPESESAPGSVSQVRECALRLTRVAKTLHIPICLIGHVTKEGTVAGPRTLEHMVDAVLYLEGERFHTYRLLRGVKNRFGATHEVGVFEMTSTGMHDVPNPSGLFLAERHGETNGSAVVVSMEGTRPLLVEVQALATTATLGVPRVSANGFDRNRLTMLLAVLIKRVGLGLGTQDVYVNIAGGFTLDEPAVDLGVAIAVASSFLERDVERGTILLGEIGLGGELRPVPRTQARVREAEKLGFTRCIIPVGGAGREDDLPAGGIEIIHARNVREVIDSALTV